MSLANYKQWSEVTDNCKTIFPASTSGVLIVRDELNASSSALGDGRLVLIDYFEEKAHGRTRRQTTKLPRARATNSNF